MRFEHRHNDVLVRYFPSLIEHKSPSDVFPGQKATNLMIIGRDADYNDQDQVIKTHARSDLLMVAHIDYANNTVSLLSIPRDTAAEIPGHGMRKINAAHAYGGPRLAEKTVHNTFGIGSDKYIALDFQGFEKAIDLLGGVDLVVDKKMDYDDNWGHLHILLLPGYQHLNGREAMGFVRFRHSDSDFVRTQRQQTLIAALKAKLRDPMVLTKLPAILAAIDEHTDTDLTDEQKVVIAEFVHSVPHANVSMQTLPSLDARSNLVATDWPHATPIIQQIFGVTPPAASTNASRSSRHVSRHRRHGTVSVAERI